ncbi:MAG TPA: methyltransferase domain-containing protein, partial [Candidatus Bathyarchaeia archaeon]|nr:methyltransferase domain-containing protein [Candidatus Bathyarchaeia archaeon]
IIVFPENRGRQDWARNLRVSRNARIYTQTEVYGARARFRKITGTNDPNLAVFTRKYGFEIVRQRYWGQSTYVQLQATSAETVNKGTIVHDDLEAAFDAVAEDYDRHIFGNPINTWLRYISVQILTRHFPPGSTILEVGCGTGTETLSLARHGVTVLACDISGKMLNVLEEKAKREGLLDHVIPIHCRPDELKEKVSALGYEKIDGAFSTYGAINTEPRLKVMFRDLHDMLREDGTLVLGVWNKYCVYETIGYLLTGRPGLAFARLRNPVPIGRSRFCVKSNAYSVASLAEHLDHNFKLNSVFGVVILLPPSNLTRYLPGKRWFNLFKRLDLLLGRIFPFNRLGDHFVAIYVNNRI